LFLVKRELAQDIRGFRNMRGQPLLEFGGQLLNRALARGFQHGLHPLGHSGHG